MRLKLLLLLFFVYSFTWSQITFSPSTTTAGTFKVPAGVTSLSVECWGAGGAGGGVYNLVSLFGGGGGGGGAYGKVTSFGVTPAAVLNYKVGVGGVGVNGADGSNGEATYFSTVTAQGGFGGKHGNTANGIGGAGGAAGTGTSFSGGSGGAGNLVGTILPVLSSGGGGGSAGTVSAGNNGSSSGTAGGLAVTGGGAGANGSAVIGGGNGSPGFLPGGGGSGALGLLLTNFKGGDGANGQIKVIYTCPTYSFTGITAADVCLSNGTTSLVRLTGAGLPVGDYVVNYTTSNPSASLTANATVSTAGTLEFTATGLNSNGSSTITVTRLTSEACLNNFTTGNAVTINVYAGTVGGTINIPAAICSGNTSSLLTLSGHTGSVVKWQYAVSPFSTWIDIANTTSTYTSGPLTQTTQFRAVIKNGNGACSEVNSAVSTVTVNPLPTIATTGTVTPICFSGSAQTATLPYTATSNTALSYSIVWSAAANTAGLANQGVTSFAFAPGGGNLNTIVIPANVAANTYTGTMTIQNANCSATQAIQITINATSVGGTINTPAAICSGSTSGLLTLSGHTGSVVKWQSALSPFSTWTDISNILTTYTSGALTQTTQFRAVVKNGVCGEVNSVSTTVTVNPLPTITTTGTVTPICFSGSTQTATLPYTATSNTPLSYSIVWSGAANTAGLANQGVTSFAFAPGGGNLNTIAIPANLAANTYTGTMTIQNANCSATQAIELTIIPKPDAPTLGTITQPTCVVTTGSVTLSGLPSTVNWTIRQSGTASTTYAGTGTGYTVSGLAVGTYQFTVEYTGSCTSALSSNVVVNPLITNTYNGSWSNGTPTINHNLVFASAYTSAGLGLGDLSGCTCTVNSGINVLISSFDTLTINNSVTNNGGILTFENNASLLQITNAVNTGNIIFERASMPMKNFDFTYWASPVTGQTLYNLSPNTLADKYFSYTGTAWKIENPVSTIMKPGTGYIIRTPKEGHWPNGENVGFPYSQEVQFVGVPNNGNITGESVIAGNYYLVGNPYPSALDADKFLFANPNPNNSAVLDGTIYLWTHNTAIAPSGSKYVYTSNDYASYNGVGGIATLPSASGGALPNGKIASGQSFFALASANGTIVFNNGMRVAGNNNQFFKPAKAELLEKHRAWLNMANTGGAFKQLLIGYVEGATNGFDSSFDGLSFDGNSFIDFYSINEGSNLVIQGRKLPFTDSDIVPLGYRTTIAGAFTISIDHTDGILSNQAVFVEDKLTNTLHDLTQSNYTFNTAIGVFNNRFVLRYTNKTLGIDNFNEADKDVVVWVENKNIKLRSEKENINKVFIYDVSGKLVYSNAAISASEITINNLRFKNELLLVKVVLANTDILTKKIITSFK